MPQLLGTFIQVTGIVQGVGFRPFVYGLATRMGLMGWVRNTSSGVEIRIDGTEIQLADFIDHLQQDAPPLSKIDHLYWENRVPDGFQTFEVLHSENIPAAFQPVSPDMSICPDCLGELFDPGDRRYRYPFINCTNCGPRFTIIEDLPYDRPLTTMAGFSLCPDCAGEYEDPLDRRFHAQPVACRICGPDIWFEEGGQDIRTTLDEMPPSSEALCAEAGLRIAQTWLAEGKIVAIKGLGGFHLACDATNNLAVSALRERKLRVDKPFAVMMADMSAIRRCCFVDPAEQNLLESRQRPIVILRRRPDAPISPAVAPGQATLGVMLPYTPLHYLLLGDSTEYPAQPAARMLVMTSGNLAEEPIAFTNPTARKQLSSLADGFLMHNRPIRVRCDDSVVRIYPTPGSSGLEPSNEDRSLLPIRRARGYAPFPVKLAWAVPPVLAAGAELKNTFCITRDRYAFLSQHVGDLENFETLQAFEDSVQHFERLFRIAPKILAYDLHPDYLASRYILNRSQQDGIPAVGIQHHHAHIAACMAENGLTENNSSVIGVAFDGTGYGDDGAIWGGEFLQTSLYGYQRLAHLRYMPLPGGDRAIREPWRIALAYLHELGLEWTPDLAPVSFGRQSLSIYPEGLDILENQLTKGIHSPLTSSMGRLFDAVASLAGLRQVVNYEAQAAIELESIIDGQASSRPYEFAIRISEVSDGQLLIDPTPCFVQILADLRSGKAAGQIAARFHAGVARMVLEVCRQIRQTGGCDQVALSGGVWQNLALATQTIQLLEADQFHVYIHRRVPPNDGGLALGQALAAVQMIGRGA